MFCNAWLPSLSPPPNIFASSTYAHVHQPHKASQRPASIPIMVLVASIPASIPTMVLVSCEECEGVLARIAAMHQQGNNPLYHPAKSWAMPSPPSFGPLSNKLAIHMKWQWRWLQWPAVEVTTVAGWQWRWLQRPAVEVATVAGSGGGYSGRQWRWLHRLAVEAATVVGQWPAVEVATMAGSGGGYSGRQRRWLQCPASGQQWRWLQCPASGRQWRWLQWPAVEVAAVLLLSSLLTGSRRASLCCHLVPHPWPHRG